LRKIRILFRIISILLTDPRLTISFLKNLVFLLFLRVKLSFRKRKLLVIALTEQLGDIVAAEPINDYLKRKYPEAFICRVVDKKYVSLTKADPSISASVAVTCFSEWILLKYFLPRKNIYDLHINEKGCSRHHLVNIKANPSGVTIDNYYKKGNLLYAFSRSSGVNMPDNIAPALHLPLENPGVLYSKYIVAHTSTNNPERMWRKECWNEVARFILSNFSEYAVVEIGYKKSITDNDKRIIDMTGEKELSQIAGLINDSSLFIGVDSAFAHFANALNKDAIILIGATGHFREYMPYSGKFMEERDNIILYYDGPLTGMPCSHVFSLLQKKLSQ
jgi:heptosyltransferase III